MMGLTRGKDPVLAKSGYERDGEEEVERPLEKAREGE